MTYNIDEIKDLQGAPLQQKGQEIKQRFDFRRNFYHNLRNNIFNTEDWNRLNQAIIDFDKNSYNPWNTEWNTILRAPTAAAFNTFFTKGINMFAALENKVGDIRPYKIEYQNSEEVEFLKKDLFRKIEEDFITLKSDIQIQINNGIDNLLNLKAELGLHQNFSENLRKVKKTSFITKYTYFCTFILSLVGIGAFIFGSFFIDKINTLEIFEKISLRIGVTISLGFLSYFLFNQFKLYQLMHLKYIHLDNFLGGGATYITQIIGQDDELKKNTNQRLADMFMEIDDMTSTIKKMKHPTEFTIKSTNETLKTITDKLGDITNVLNALKK
jgi:hypothetical protein